MMANIHGDFMTSAQLNTDYLGPPSPDSRHLSGEDFHGLWVDDGESLEREQRLNPDNRPDPLKANTLPAKKNESKDLHKPTIFHIPPAKSEVVPWMYAGQVMTGGCGANPPLVNRIELDDFSDGGKESLGGLGGLGERDFADFGRDGRVETAVDMDKIFGIGEGREV